jgi:ubiquinol-cytochrome c reductase cytochrome c subunit
VSWWRALLPTLVISAGVFGVVFPGHTQVEAGSDDEAEASVLQAGETLFLERCSSCHGVDGTGTDQAPDITDAGAAAADFVLSTGRMPPGEDEVQALRRPPQFDADEQVALVAHVSSLGDGPAIPTVDIDNADAAEGGALFRELCAVCHQAGGAGAALSEGRVAPSLGEATPTQIVEAMTIGPGAMPVFTGYEPQELDDIAAYVTTIEAEPDPGGFSLGRVGPVAEGLVAWVVGLGALVLIAMWIGTRERASDA